MGAVYRAVREDDFRMQVAIKLLKRGTDTDAALGPLPRRAADSGRRCSIPISRACWTAAPPRRACPTS